MALVVKKFGGSSVATTDKILNVAKRVLSDKQPDDKVVVVVSAMGDTTDDLIGLAQGNNHSVVFSFEIFLKRLWIGDTAEKVNGHDFTDRDFFRRVVDRISNRNAHFLRPHQRQNP